ncbi:sulfatase [Halobacteriaceae archaeon SHR40]|uniref:sulfatase n=1 Tax=Halovenus amylolytica TaxID=2500550 RepID=UPI000FE3E68E
MRRNIVLVTVDSLRADHCSFMTAGETTTPTLDRMAADGARFESAIAPGPSTPESMPAVFTGRYPVETIDPSDVDEARTRIRRHMTTRETIPERLSRRGYATAGFTPNPYTSQYFGFDAGFDNFEDFTNSGIRTAGDGLLQRFSPNSDAVQATRMFVNLIRQEEVFKPWEAYAESVSRWIESTEQPYFAWIHMMDPHVPYMAPRSYRHQSWWRTLRANVAFWRGDNESALDQSVLERLRQAYVDTIRYTDAFFEHIESVTDDDTAIVVHADHGEAFGEHGSYGHEPYLYEENIHVPLVVSGVPSRVIERPVSLRSVPTLAVQLAEEQFDPAALGTEFAVSRTAKRERVALRGRRLKYIHSESGPEMYDLRHGEHEQCENEDLRAICEGRLQQVDANMAEGRAVRTAANNITEGRS